MIKMKVISKVGLTGQTLCLHIVDVHRYSLYFRLI